MKTMPQIPEVEKRIRMTTQFTGYNRADVISDGECYDMKNLSGDAFPALTVRKKRITVQETETETLNGILGRSDGEVVIRGERVTYKGEDTGLRVSTDRIKMPKILVSMGAYVTIWPDKVYFNTTDLKDQGRMDRLWAANEHVTYTTEPGEIPTEPPEDAPTICLCRGDGTDYDMTEIDVGTTPPANPDDGDYWLDQSGDTDVLRQYSSSREMWVEVPTVYLKIACPEIGKGLSRYDVVDICGLQYTWYREQDEPEPDDRLKAQLAALNASHIVYQCGQDYIVIVGILSKQVTLDDHTLNIDRKIPDMDYVTESNNRLWGCKYGYDKQLEPGWSGSAHDTKVYLSTKTGSRISRSDYTKSSTAPENPVNGQLWMNTANPPDDYQYPLMKYNATAGEWQQVPCYVTFESINTNLGQFKAGSWVEITGVIYQGGGSIELDTLMQMRALNTHKQVISCYQNWLTVEGVLSGEYECGQEGTNMKVYKAAPEYKFLNEIRSCKLGDFKNWSTYMGLSTDSYAATVGTDGPFTGAIMQLGYPVFFKENAIHKIYGYNPDSFQIQTTVCSGIQNGSWRSAVVVDETVFYKSSREIMAYDGNMPRGISEQLGNTVYGDARAGAFDQKYYISMYNATDEKWELFCYDTRKGLWFKEDGTKALGFGRTDTALYMIDEEKNLLISPLGDSGGFVEEEPVTWEAVFGISGIEYTGYGRSDVPGHIYLSRFDLRMYVEPDTTADLWIEYDSSGHWEHQGQIRGKNRRTFMLPVRPKRCDHMRVKLTGQGMFKLYSIARIMEVGADG